MSVDLNHTIVHARDNRASADFLAGILGLTAGPAWHHFVPLVLGNGVTLDFASVPAGAAVTPQHYAFLISEEEFDSILGRIREREITFYPGPSLDRPGEIGHPGGGRGLYFAGPEGHFYEIMTRPYA